MSINTIQFGEVIVRDAVSESTELAYIELSLDGFYASIRRDKKGIFGVVFGTQGSFWGRIK
jgi:hypothetical protein